MLVTLLIPPPQSLTARLGLSIAPEELNRVEVTPIHSLIALLDKQLILSKLYIQTFLMCTMFLSARLHTR